MSKMRVRRFKNGWDKMHPTTTTCTAKYGKLHVILKQLTRFRNRKNSIHKPTNAGLISTYYCLYCAFGVVYHSTRSLNTMLLTNPWMLVAGRLSVSGSCDRMTARKSAFFFVWTKTSVFGLFVPDPAETWARKPWMEIKDIHNQSSPNIIKPLC